MSWFDTSNIVSLAKSTLKEAQKTIDKALDITDEEAAEDGLNTSSENAAKIVSEPSTPLASNSIWGSFTGSFFEATSPDSSTGVDTPSVTQQPNSSSLQESFSLIKQRSLASSSSSKTKQQQQLSRSFEQTRKSKAKNDQVDGDKVKVAAFRRDKDIKAKEENAVEDETKLKTDKDTNVSSGQSKEIRQSSNTNPILDPQKNALESGDLESENNAEETESKSEKAQQIQSFEVEQSPADDSKKLNIDSKRKSTITESNQTGDGEAHRANVCDISLDSKTNCSDSSENTESNTVSNVVKTIDDPNCEKIQSNNDSCEIQDLTNKSAKQKLSTHKGSSNVIKNSEIYVKQIADPKQKPNENVIPKVELQTNSEVVESLDPKTRESEEVRTSSKDDTTVEKLLKLKPSSTESQTKPASSHANLCEDNNSSAEQIAFETTQSKANDKSTSPPSEIILRRKAPSESEVREKRRSDRYSTGSTGGNNRLSTISADSVRLSSDGSTSVEIIVSPDSGGEGSRSLSNSSMTSPSVEIISESSGKVASRSSESVEVLRSSDEDSKEEGEEGGDMIEEGEEEEEEEGEDSYLSMSESTQTLTTAMNLMLKSSSSLETSFSDMGSSRENISLSRTLHLPLSQYPSQAETPGESKAQPTTQTSIQPTPQLTQPSTQSTQPSTQPTQPSTQPISKQPLGHADVSNSQPMKNTESHSSAKSVSFTDDCFSSQSQSGSKSHSDAKIVSPEPGSSKSSSDAQILSPESVSSKSSSDAKIVSPKPVSSKSSSDAKIVSPEPNELDSTLESQASLSLPLSDTPERESVMDGSASTLVASSDDGTFVHIPGDSSPVSLERCELIKIGSGHTSGDDMDTNTTSSSIEIISSPYGDTSSTASRISPSKLPLSSSPRASTRLGAGAQTHRRAPSETSSEDTEAEKLQKKISEMTEVLEARELKLVSLSKQHSELNEVNSKLKLEKDSMARMNAEFTQRLASLEKQHQQVMTEKENLRRLVEATRLAASSQRSDEDKDEIIAQLRTEGAALSRQQMLLTTSVRRLRAAEKEANRARDSLRAELETRAGDLERLQKLVQAKEEVERSQIEAVNQLSKTNARLERDVTSLQQQLDNLTSTLIESQKELQSRTAALAEMETKLAANTSRVEARLRLELEAEVRAEAGRREEVEASLDQLRHSLVSGEQEHTRQIEALRRENLATLRRLEEAQARAEALAESMISTASPLAREIETLSASHARESEAWEREERRLNETINELQARVTSLKHLERTAKESSISTSTRISALQSQLESEHRDVLRLREQLLALHEDVEKMGRDKESALQAKDAQVASLHEELAECRRCCSALEQRLSVQTAALESERRRNVTLQNQMQQMSPGQMTGQAVSDGRDTSATPPPFLSHSQRSSPLSLGRPVSVTDSVFPPSEEGDHAHSSFNKSVYDSLRLGGSTSLIESLQSQVKLKDTEVTHLQWELSRRELERASLTAQLTDMTSRLETCELRMRDTSELQGQYDALLQMYGEKLEECQELRLDLDDVKEMYKAQIDQLLKKDESG